MTTENNTLTQDVVEPQNERPLTYAERVLRSLQNIANATDTDNPEALNTAYKEFNMEFPAAFGPKPDASRGRSDYIFTPKMPVPSKKETKSNGNLYIHNGIDYSEEAEVERHTRIDHLLNLRKNRPSPEQLSKFRNANTEKIAKGDVLPVTSQKLIDQVAPSNSTDKNERRSNTIQSLDDLTVISTATAEVPQKTANNSPSPMFRIGDKLKAKPAESDEESTSNISLDQDHTNESTSNLVKDEIPNGTFASQAEDSSESIQDTQQLSSENLSRDESSGQGNKQASDSSTKHEFTNEDRKAKIEELRQRLQEKRNKEEQVANESSAPENDNTQSSNELTIKPSHWQEALQMVQNGQIISEYRIKQKLGVSGIEAQQILSKLERQGIIGPGLSYETRSILKTPDVNTGSAEAHRAQVPKGQQESTELQHDQLKQDETQAQKVNGNSLFNRAVNILPVLGGTVSMSALQRRLSLTPSQAAEIIVQLEDEGYIAPDDVSASRTIIKMPPHYQNGHAPTNGNGSAKVSTREYGPETPAYEDNQFNREQSQDSSEEQLGDSSKPLMSGKGAFEGGSNLHEELRRNQYLDQNGRRTRSEDEEEYREDKARRRLRKNSDSIISETAGYNNFNPEEAALDQPVDKSLLPESQVQSKESASEVQPEEQIATAESAISAPETRERNEVDIWFDDLKNLQESYNAATNSEEKAIIRPQLEELQNKLFRRWSETTGTYWKRKIDSSSLTDEVKTQIIAKLGDIINQSTYPEEKILDLLQLLAQHQSDSYDQYAYLATKFLKDRLSQGNDSIEQIESQTESSGGEEFVSDTKEEKESNQEQNKTEVSHRIFDPNISEENNSYEDKKFKELGKQLVEVRQSIIQQLNTENSVLALGQLNDEYVKIQRAMMEQWFTQNEKRILAVGNRHRDEDPESFSILIRKNLIENYNMEEALHIMVMIEQDMRFANKNEQRQMNRLLLNMKEAVETVEGGELISTQDLYGKTKGELDALGIHYKYYSDNTLLENTNSELTDNVRVIRVSRFGFKSKNELTDSVEPMVVFGPASVK